MLNPEVFGWLDSLWGPTPLTDLQTLSMLKYPTLILDSGHGAQRLWMPSPVTGERILAGGAPQFT